MGPFIRIVSLFKTDTAIENESVTRFHDSLGLLLLLPFGNLAKLLLPFLDPKVAQQTTTYKIIANPAVDNSGGCVPRNPKITYYSGGTQNL